MSPIFFSLVRLFILFSAKEYQHEDFVRKIIRLEQADHACLQRKIAVRGAFAVLVGYHSKHFIRKPEV